MLPADGTISDDGSYAHEIKWDGYRAIAYLEKTEVRLLSRNQKILNGKFPALINDLKCLGLECILDGEITAFSPEGKQEFGLIRANQKPKALYYLVFDLLFFANRPLCETPWFKRRDLLEEILPSSTKNGIKIAPILPTSLSQALELVEQHGLEGIVSKKKDAPYEPGVRSPFWCKHKLLKTMDCVVVGVNVADTRIRSCKVAVYRTDGALHYLGNVGSGLGETELNFLSDALRLLSTAQAPINTGVDESEVVWLKPHLVMEISYLETTSLHRLRQPVFSRFRFDKEARDCVWEMD